MLELNDFLKTVSGEADPTDENKRLAQSIFELYERDVQGLKNTNAMLKEEKSKDRTDFNAFKEKVAQEKLDLETKLQDAQKQIASNNPEDAKKYYDTQLANVDSIYKSQLSAKDSELNELKSRISAFEKKDLLRSQEVEFEREIRKTKAVPSAYEWIKTLVLGEDGRNFEQHDTADGKMFWASDKSGETIANRIEKVLKSDVGQRFCDFASSGSGAEGGAKNSYSGTNPFKTGNFTEQMKIWRENPKLAAQLEAQAGAK